MGGFFTGDNNPWVGQGGIDCIPTVVRDNRNDKAWQEYSQEVDRAITDLVAQRNAASLECEALKMMVVGLIKKYADHVSQDEVDHAFEVFKKRAAEKHPHLA